MSKRELLKHKMTRMTDTMKADIQASADKHSEGVFAVELRALIEIGLRVRKQEIEKLSAELKTANCATYDVSFSYEGAEVCDAEHDDFDTKDDLYAAGYDGDM